MTPSQMTATATDHALDRLFARALCHDLAAVMPTVALVAPLFGKSLVERTKVDHIRCCLAADLLIAHTSPGGRTLLVVGLA